MSGDKSISGLKTSMKCWLEEINIAGRRNDPFVIEMTKEESLKATRLKTLSKSVNLPIYDDYEFALPENGDKLINISRKFYNEKFCISFRLFNELGSLIFRDVDIDFIGICRITNGIREEGCFAAYITPYKKPDISGTLLVCNGFSVLEIVYGPHYCLTKYAPSDIRVYRCLYGFPHLSVKYSTANQAVRSLLFKHLKYSLYYSTGYLLDQLTVSNLSVYAEYHWSRDMGYKFLECSQSYAWTGDVNSQQCMNYYGFFRSIY